MHDLHEQLEQSLQGRVCLVGVGNVDFGDDGFGVRLAEALQIYDLRFANYASRVLMAGNTPERLLIQLTDGGYDNVIFLDVVEFGGAHGSVIFLGSEEIATRFPQISTHKISLGLLAKSVEGNGTAKAWLLGVQPESLKSGANLSAAVQTTLEILTEMLSDGLTCVAAYSAIRTPQSAILC